MGRWLRARAAVPVVLLLLAACTGPHQDLAPRPVQLAPASWSALPHAPLVSGPRHSQAMAWTGTQALVWGGAEADPRCGTTPAFNDGAALDPATGTWAPLPASPLSVRSDTQAQWTGQQLLLIGGQHVQAPRTQKYGCRITPLLDGAAYTPAPRGPEGRTGAGGSWQQLPPAPLPIGGRIITTTWTGSELLAWAGRDGAAAYDPSHRRWRTLSPAPVPPGLPPTPPAEALGYPVLPGTTASSVWTGHEWLIWASVDDAQYHATAWSLGYSPDTDTWRTIADGPPTRESSHRFWDGTRAVALDFTHPVPAGAQNGPLSSVTAAVDSFDPATDTWTSGPPSPEVLTRSSAVGATLMTAGRLVTWATAIIPAQPSCGPGAACGVKTQPVTYTYDTTRRRWQALTAGPWEHLNGASALWMGDRVLVTGGTAVLQNGGMTKPSGTALPAGILTLP